MDINSVLNNKNNIYYGHGTGMEDETTINSIMNNGLRCSHNYLYFTSVPLGIGGEIGEEEIQMLKSWPHKDSKVVVIVSLPLKYKILDAAGTYNMGESAYYYIPNEELRKKYPLTNSNYVMPEFIMGYYDARIDSFIENPKYYENMKEEDQKVLFEQVKENYFDVIDNGWDIEEYKEVCKEIGMEFSLTDEEVYKFKRKKEERLLLEQFDKDILEKELLLPNGDKIRTKEYLKELVLPYIPLTGTITLNNGSSIPVTHFILECVIYDCQERYNGDFARYLIENVESLENKDIKQI